MKLHLAQALSDARLSDILSNTNINGGGDNSYLAGEHPVKNGNDMKIYLAGEHGKKKICEQNLYGSSIKLKDLNILESYYYLQNNADFMRLVPYINSFLLDSGAFSFIQGKHNERTDWDRYIENYASFINYHDIKLFFELDIDSIVGIEKVNDFRDRLQKLTGKPPIPVWHRNRGKQYFIDMCKEYPYVTLGGIAIKEIKRDVFEKVFPWFISTAHKYGAKIHGLGYTSVEGLKKYHFDSVDSTAWLYGNRSGWIERFDPTNVTMNRYVAKKGSRLKSKQAAINNFIEWAKFAKYIEQYT